MHRRVTHKAGAAADRIYSENKEAGRGNSAVHSLGIDLEEEVQEKAGTRLVEDQIFRDQASLGE